MRLLRLCLLILALRLFLSDPIMCYDVVCCFSFGRGFVSSPACPAEPAAPMCSGLLKLSGEYVTTFWGESQAERDSMPHFFAESVQ